MILTVGRLKELLEDCSDDMIILSSGHELEEKDITKNVFQYLVKENGKFILKDALQIG